MDPSAPGWYPDPSGRHERRYFSGIRWSRHVDDGGRRAQDPIEPVAERHRPLLARLRSQQPESVVSSGHVPVASPAPVELTRDLEELPSGAAGTPARAEEPWFDRDPRPPGRRRLGRLGLAVGGIAVLAAAGTVLLTTRGDDGGGAEDADDAVAGVEQADDPLTAYLVDYTRRASGETISDEDAGCMAGRIVDVMTRERLMEAGVVGADDPLAALPHDDAATFATAGLDCLPDSSLVTYMAATWNPEWFGGIPATGAPCVYQGLTDGWGRRQTVEVFGQLAIPGETRSVAEIAPELSAEVVDEVVADCK